MTGQTVILNSPARIEFAHRLVNAAPWGAVLNVRESDRTTDQNAKFWAMLSDVSRSKPEGRKHSPDVWKSLFMAACGHAVQFEVGLDGHPFPIGFRSSKLSKHQMSELIEFMLHYGAQHGVKWTNEVKE